MPTPFPGMDPYLERRGLWREVHTGLIVGISHFLTPLLRPRYRVAIEQHTFLTLTPVERQGSGIPDVMVVSAQQPGATATAAATATTTAQPLVGELPMLEEIKQRYLEIREVETGQVITAVEILSPTNKVGDGRNQYQKKRLQVLSSLTNLVEIDLLRAGEPLPMQVAATNDYRIVVSRASQRPRADIYLFGVRDPIPDFPIPLKPGEEEPTLKLNQILHQLYDQSGYDLAINYTHTPDPPLSEADTSWADKLLGTQS